MLLTPFNNYVSNDNHLNRDVSFSGDSSVKSSCLTKVEDPYEADSVPSPHDASPDLAASGSAADFPRDPQRVETSPLIMESSYRHLDLRVPHSSPTLSSPYLSHQHRRENGFRRFPVNASSSSDYRDLSTSYGLQRPSAFESSTLSSILSQNVPLSSSDPRLRTYPPVFQTTSDLATHHGIPQQFPAPPRTTRVSAEPSTIKSQPPTDSSIQSATSNDFDFEFLRTNYLAMLASGPMERMNVTDVAPPIAQDAPDARAVQEVVDVLLGIILSENENGMELMDLHVDATATSPDFGNYDEFLTGSLQSSPLEDFNDFLATPVSGYLTNPDVFEGDDVNDPNSYSQPLFLNVVPHSSKLPLVGQNLLQPSVNLDDATYTMLPSPVTSSLDPASLHPSPRVEPQSSLPSSSADATASKKKGPAPTGTRKNVTPESLVPMDAPIQSRKYVTPSATSRKDVPAVFAKKKRSRSSAFGEDDDEPLDVSQLDANELDAIEAKRRQNTLAARRSRKRKLEYQRELEASVDKEREEKEMWKARAMTFHALLVSNGLDVPALEQ